MPLSSSALSRLQYQHETIRELIKGFDTGQLKREVNPGKWSLFENVAHLVAYQPTFMHRVQLMEQKDNPSFDRYVADNDPAFHQCVQLDIKELLEDLSTQRFIIHKHISSLGETVLRRTGQHAKYGNMSISQWTEFFLLHEAHHLFTSFMLAAELRKTLQQ
jgi:hypothetical protein